MDNHHHNWLQFACRIVQLIKLQFYSIWLDFIGGENNQTKSKGELTPNKHQQAAIKFIAVVDCWLVLITLCENLPDPRQ